MPHFRYGVGRTADMKAVGADAAGAFDAGKVNFLFFGNIMYNKGIDLLVAAANRLPPEAAQGIRIVVAGKRLDDALYAETPLRPEMFRIMARHINDDELAYLYSGTDYVVLPYRKTAQSGIMEMAFHFRRPVVASDLPYFRQVIDSYPSFGVVTSTEPGAFAAALAGLVADRGRRDFFSAEDVARYEYSDGAAAFVEEFGRFVSCMD